MKYIRRILACPFIFGLILVSNIWSSFTRTFAFIKHGGEFNNYNKNTRATMQRLYLELKRQA